MSSYLLHGADGEPCCDAVCGLKVVPWPPLSYRGEKEVFKKKHWEERNNNKQWEGVLNRERDKTEEKRRETDEKEKGQK